MEDTYAIGGLTLGDWKRVDIKVQIRHLQDRLAHGKMGPKRRARIGAQLDRARAQLVAQLLVR